MIKFVFFTQFRIPCFIVLYWWSGATSQTVIRSNATEPDIGPEWKQSVCLHYGPVSGPWYSSRMYWKPWMTDLINTSFRISHSATPFRILYVGSFRILFRSFITDKRQRSPENIIHRCLRVSVLRGGGRYIKLYITHEARECIHYTPFRILCWLHFVF